MGRLPLEKDFTDREGVSHHYESAPLPFKVAVRLGLELSALLTPILGGVASAFFGVSDDTGEDLDPVRAIAGVEQLPGKILDIGGHDLIKRILCETVRSSEATDADPASKLLLNTDDNLTAAYSGNFAEMFKAISWVLSVNYSPFGTDETEGWSQLYTTLRAKWNAFNAQNSTTTDESPSTKSESTGKS